MRGRGINAGDRPECGDAFRANVSQEEAFDRKARAMSGKVRSAEPHQKMVGRPQRRNLKLAADAEAQNQGLVALRTPALQVIQQPAAAGNHDE